MDELKKIAELKDYIEKAWFYDNEDCNCKLINVDGLLNFIEWLENN